MNKGCVKNRSEGCNNKLCVNNRQSQNNYKEELKRKLIEIEELEGISKQPLWKFDEIGAKLGEDPYWKWVGIPNWKLNELKEFLNNELKKREELKRKLIEAEWFYAREGNVKEKYNEEGIEIFRTFHQGNEYFDRLKWTELNSKDWKRLKSRYNKEMKFRAQLKEKLIKLGTLPAIWAYDKITFDENYIYTYHCKWLDEKLCNKWDWNIKGYWSTLESHYNEYMEEMKFRVQLKEKLIKLGTLPKTDNYGKTIIDKYGFHHYNEKDIEYVEWERIGEENWNYLKSHYNEYMKGMEDFKKELIKLGTLPKFSGYYTKEFHKDHFIVHCDNGEICNILWDENWYTRNGYAQLRKHYNAYLNHKKWKEKLRKIIVLPETDEYFKSWFNVCGIECYKNGKHVKFISWEELSENDLYYLKSQYNAIMEKLEDLKSKLIKFGELPGNDLRRRKAFTKDGYFIESSFTKWEDITGDEIHHFESHYNEYMKEKEVSEFKNELIKLGELPATQHHYSKKFYNDYFVVQFHKGHSAELPWGKNWYTENDYAQLRGHYKEYMKEKCERLRNKSEQHLKDLGVKFENGYPIFTIINNR